MLKYYLISLFVCWFVCLLAFFQPIAHHTKALLDTCVVQRIVCDKAIFLLNFGCLFRFIFSSCDRPRVIEALRGKSLVDIACGGSHSACITTSGELYTWGKGRYGRLGHGDSEDQLLPKLVEALRGQRVIDVACGSGDAQTLCLTDNDCVWSWGDGDYGKLGRGGSDGCKIPMKVESLMRAGVCKVECGSQFSVALTKSGAVYTW